MANNKKNMKINKIDNHWEKYCHKIYQFAGLLGHIGLHIGIPPQDIFLWTDEGEPTCFQQVCEGDNNIKWKNTMQESLNPYMKITHGIWLNG